MLDLDHIFRMLLKNFLNFTNLQLSPQVSKITPHQSLTRLIQTTRFLRSAFSGTLALNATSFSLRIQMLSQIETRRVSSSLITQSCLSLSTWLTESQSTHSWVTRKMTRICSISFHSWRRHSIKKMLEWLVRLVSSCSISCPPSAVENR